MFNIEKWLQSNNTPIRYTGENVKKGNININCPMCVDSGRGDTNFHMGINPKNGKYGCWRNQTHRGGKLEKVVRLLAHCSYDEAHLIVYGVILDRPESQSLSDFVKKLLNKSIEGKKEVTTGPKELLFPNEFIDIKSTGVTKKFYDYLENRGFNDVKKLIKNYSLFCCLNGEYADRIIFPMFYGGELVTWSSRTIKDDWLRYKDLGVEKSVIHVKQLLYNYDELVDGGNKLFITEGLFDCIKLDYYFRNNRATCLSTKSITDSQADQVRSLSKVFKKIVILTDNDAKSSATGISRLFCSLPNVSYKFLPKGFKDPGDFTEKEITDLERE